MSAKDHFLIPPPLLSSDEFEFQHSEYTPLMWGRLLEVERSCFSVVNASEEYTQERVFFGQLIVPVFFLVPVENYNFFAPRYCFERVLLFSLFSPAMGEVRNFKIFLNLHFQSISLLAGIFRILISEQFQVVFSDVTQDLFLVHLTNICLSVYTLLCVWQVFTPSQSFWQLFLAYSRRQVWNCEQQPPIRFHGFRCMPCCTNNPSAPNNNNQQWFLFVSFLCNELHLMVQICFRIEVVRIFSLGQQGADWGLPLRVWSLFFFFCHSENLILTTYFI